MQNYEKERVGRPTASSTAEKLFLELLGRRHSSDLSNERDPDFDNLDTLGKTFTDYYTQIAQEAIANAARGLPPQQSQPGAKAAEATTPHFPATDIAYLDLLKPLPDKPQFDPPPGYQPHKGYAIASQDRLSVVPKVAANVVLVAWNHMRRGGLPVIGIGKDPDEALRSQQQEAANEAGKKRAEVASRNAIATRLINRPTQGLDVVLDHLAIIAAQINAKITANGPATYELVRYAAETIISALRKDPISAVDRANGGQGRTIEGYQMLIGLAVEATKRNLRESFMKEAETFWGKLQLMEVNPRIGSIVRQIAHPVGSPVVNNFLKNYWEDITIKEVTNPGREKKITTTVEDGVETLFRLATKGSDEQKTIARAVLADIAATIAPLLAEEQKIQDEVLHKAATHGTESFKKGTKARTIQDLGVNLGEPGAVSKVLAKVSPADYEELLELRMDRVVHPLTDTFITFIAKAGNVDRVLGTTSLDVTFAQSPLLKEITSATKEVIDRAINAALIPPKREGKLAQPLVNPAAMQALALSTGKSDRDALLDSLIEDAQPSQAGESEDRLLGSLFAKSKGFVGQTDIYLAGAVFAFNAAEEIVDSKQRQKMRRLATNYAIAGMLQLSKKEQKQQELAETCSELLATSIRKFWSAEDALMVAKVLQEQITHSINPERSLLVLDPRITRVIYAIKGKVLTSQEINRRYSREVMGPLISNMITDLQAEVDKHIEDKRLGGRIDMLGQLLLNGLSKGYFPVSSQLFLSGRNPETGKLHPESLDLLNLTNLSYPEYRLYPSVHQLGLPVEENLPLTNREGVLRAGLALIGPYLQRLKIIEDQKAEAGIEHRWADQKYNLNTADDASPEAIRQTASVFEHKVQTQGNLEHILQASRLIKTGGLDLWSWFQRLCANVQLQVSLDFTKSNNFNPDLIVLNITDLSPELVSGLGNTTVALMVDVFNRQRYRHEPPAALINSLKERILTTYG